MAEVHLDRRMSLPRVHRAFGLPQRHDHRSVHSSALTGPALQALGPEGREGRGSYGMTTVG